MTNWGVLGLGFIADKFIDAIKEVPGAQIKGVASLTKKKSDDLIKKLGINENFFYTNYDDLINSSSIDAIYIATLNDTHAELIKRCALAKKKILCEKPMCINLKESKEVFKCLEVNNTMFLEAFAFRSHQQTINLCNIINSGEIGEIQSVDTSFGFKIKKINPNSRLFNKDYGGGAILDVGCYTSSFCLLIAKTILGEKYKKYKIRNITGSLCDTGVDICSEAELIFNDKIKMTIKTSLKENLNNNCIVYGSKGKIILSSPWLPENKSYIEIYNKDSYYKKFVNSKFSIYAQQIYRFNQKILGKDDDVFDTLMNNEVSLMNIEIIDIWKKGIENQIS